jgi:hypothetical protein
MFLTQRRQGAKKKHLQNLCAFASLREILRLKSKRRSFVGQAVHNTLDPMLDQVVPEIDEETESFIHQPQIGEHLFAVDCVKRCDRFHFHDYTTIDNQVRPKPFVEPESVPSDRNRDLSFDWIAVFAQFMCEGNFVHDLENAWPKPTVEPVGSIDDLCCDFIFFHVGKPAPLLLSHEAKKLASLPAASGSRSGMKTVITQSRQGAKKKNHQGLASLRAIPSPAGRL